MDAREIVEWVMNKVLEEMENIIDMVLQDDAKQEDAINILEFPRFDRMEFNWTEMDPIYKGREVYGKRYTVYVQRTSVPRSSGFST